jgi:Short C-terminal domain
MPMRPAGRRLVRTAAVGGMAYMAGSHVANKSAQQRELDAAQDAQIADLQQQQMAAMPPAQPAPAWTPAPAMPPPQPAPAWTPPPASAAAPARDPMEALRQLGELKAAGVVTDAEFETKKAQLLQQI